MTGGTVLRSAVSFHFSRVWVENKYEPVRHSVPTSSPTRRLRGDPRTLLRPRRPERVETVLVLGLHTDRCAVEAPPRASGRTRVLALVAPVSAGAARMAPRTSQLAEHARVGVSCDPPRSARWHVGRSGALPSDRQCRQRKAVRFEDAQQSRELLNLAGLPPYRLVALAHACEDSPFRLAVLRALPLRAPELFFRFPHPLDESLQCGRCRLAPPDHGAHVRRPYAQRHGRQVVLGGVEIGPAQRTGQRSHAEPFDQAVRVKDVTAFQRMGSLQDGVLADAADGDVHPFARTKPPRASRRSYQTVSTRTNAYQRVPTRTNAYQDHTPHTSAH